MRTTLTIADDIARELERRQRETGWTWKQVVDETLRIGIARTASPAKRSKPASTTPVRLGTPTMDISNVHELLSLVEGDARR